MLPGGRARSAGDRGVRREVALVLPPTREREPRWLGVAEAALSAVALAGAFAAGWLYAGLVDPDGALLRVTLGWLVGEFR